MQQKILDCQSSRADMRRQLMDDEPLNEIA